MPNQHLTTPAPILAAAVLWGTTGTAVSFAPAGTPAAATGCAGLALGGLLLYATARGKRLRYTGSQRWLLLLGACAVAGYPITFYPAVARTGVAAATVLALGAAPVFAGLLAWLTGHGRPTARWVLATALAVIGCAVMILDPGSDSGHAVDPLGAALAVCGGFTYAVYSWVGSRLISDGHASDRVMGAMFGLAALLVLPVVLATGTAWLTTPRGAAVALHLAVFTTFLAYRLFGYGLRHTSVAAATTLTLAEPAVAAILGVAVVGERLSLVSWCGMAVLAAALAVLTARRSPRRVVPAANAGASTRSTR
ncbi:EamA family transporter [Nocardia huaxiensis]|uniref:EamA family transporter n=1 Tax=Nocardia huaxiensis TaxID=2755382 RepID=UPI001E2B3606|nr:EamA family transporter [Nocardia huaxiensis]UFS98197.1 EamA family transporter [Nocardia huaxiensis]